MSFIVIMKYIQLVARSRLIQIILYLLFVFLVIFIVQTRNMVSQYISMSIFIDLVASTVVLVLLKESGETIDLIINWIHIDLHFCKFIILDHKRLVDLHHLLIELLQITEIHT